MTRTDCLSRLFWSCLVGGLLVSGGCARSAGGSGDEEDEALTPDSTLTLKLNGKSQVLIGGRWVDLFLQQQRVRTFVQGRAARYRQTFSDWEVELRQERVGTAVTAYLPTPVVIEVDAKTRSGAITALRRLCKEAGFIEFTVKWPEEDAAR